METTDVFVSAVGLRLGSIAILTAAWVIVQDNWVIFILEADSLGLHLDLSLATGKGQRQTKWAVSADDRNRPGSVHACFAS